MEKNWGDTPSVTLIFGIVFGSLFSTLLNVLLIISVRCYLCERSKTSIDV